MLHQTGSNRFKPVWSEGIKSWSCVGTHHNRLHLHTIEVFRYTQKVMEYRCEICDRVFDTIVGLKRHRESIHDGTVYPCTKCDQTFKRKPDLQRHIRTVHSQKEQCYICGHYVLRKDNLARHIRSQHPETLRDSDEEEPPRKKRNTAPGANIAAPKPSVPRQPNDDSVITVPRPPSPQPGPSNAPDLPQRDGLDEGEYDSNSDLLLRNQRHIKDFEKHGKRLHIYNRQLNTEHLSELRQILHTIHKQQSTQYQINFALGFVLVNTVTGERRYYHASNNTRVFHDEAYRIVRNDDDFSRLTDVLETFLDLKEYARAQRPNSQWVVSRVTNALLYVVPFNNMPIGEGGIDLPDYIKRNHSVSALVCSKKDGQMYKDNLCVFRCIALHFLRTAEPEVDIDEHLRKLEGPTHHYFNKYCQESNLVPSPNTFKGIHLNDLMQLEDIFKIRINVYQLREDNVAELVRRTVKGYETGLHLNVYDHHFSYIHDFQGYAKSFGCRTCGSVYGSKLVCLRHERKCIGGVQFTYPGGVYHPPLNIFERLEDYGIQLPSSLDRFYPYCATYDIECLMKENVSKTNSEKQCWIAEHEIMSVSVCSNVPGYENAECFVSNGDPTTLTDTFLSYLLEISTKAFQCTQLKYQSILDILEEQIEKYHSETGKADTPFKSLHEQLTKWMKQLPVIGFNSGRYDLNAMKTAFFPSLLKQNKLEFVTKKQNSYMCLSSERLRLLDMVSYLAAGTSYSKFLKAFNVEEAKGFFPYEWVDDLSKLNSDSLPPHEAFHSTLKRTNITPEEYAYCQQVWEREAMSTMKDFLIWYNNGDTKPFLDAIQKMSAYFRSRNLDIFKDGISLPGLAMKDLFTDIGTFFTLPKKSDSDMYDIVKREMVGGPSLIFHRHQEVDVTKLRVEEYGETAKLCKSVKGFDATALYLSCLMKPMATGYYCRRTDSDGFRLRHSHPYGQMAREWLTWVAQEENLEIIHEHANGKEIKIGWKSIPVDGYCKENNTIYQFHGCMVHGHDCWLTRPRKGQALENSAISGKPMAELRTNTAKITEYLIEEGFRVIEMRECQWTNAKRYSTQVGEFVRERFNTWSKMNRGPLTQNAIIDAIARGDIFGMVECDIEVPDELKPRFSEMPPIFKNVTVGRDDIGDVMRSFAEENDLLTKPRRMLIGSMFGKNILLITPLLQWYLRQGLVITKVHQVVEYEARACFEAAGKRVADARRAGDVDPDKSIISDMEKLMGNSYYGKTATNKEKFTKVAYLSDVEQSRELDRIVSRASFLSLNPLDDEYYEVETRARTIRIDLPSQIAFFVYNYAKLRMLEFYYDFMLRFFDRSDFQYCEMDTDSAYIAFSNSDWLSLMKPGLREKYLKHRHLAHFSDRYEPDNEYNWFPRDCCQEHARYDKRTPGLFHMEWEGRGIVGLCSKTYYCFGPNGDKYSCKGIQKQRNDMEIEKYKSVLKTRQSVSGTNRGFRAIDGKVLTYEQIRTGLSFFYPKRIVLEDGVSTRPLTI